MLYSGMTVQLYSLAVIPTEYLVISKGPYHGCLVQIFKIADNTSLFAMSNLMLVKKPLVNNRIAVRCQTKVSSKHFIKCYKLTISHRHPQTFCLTIVLDFSWGDCYTPEKLEIMIMQSLEGGWGGGGKGALWFM